MRQARPRILQRPLDGTRLGFEDMAALMGLRVRDIQSDRKYQGSYQRVAELLRYIQLPSDSLARFFEQAALSVMVRNGDGHLKNFGVLYRSPADCCLAPMFDVVTTAIYRYARYEGGPDLEDRTLALKLFSGRHHTKAYPTTDELCGLAGLFAAWPNRPPCSRASLKPWRGLCASRRAMTASPANSWLRCLRCGVRGLRMRGERRPR